MLKVVKILKQKGGFGTANSVSDQLAISKRWKYGM